MIITIRTIVWESLTTYFFNKYRFVSTRCHEKLVYNMSTLVGALFVIMIIYYGVEVLMFKLKGESVLGRVACQKVSGERPYAWHKNMISMSMTM